MSQPRNIRPAGKSGPYRTVRLSEAAAIELLLTTTPDTPSIVPAVWSGYFR